MGIFLHLFFFKSQALLIEHLFLSFFLYLEKEKQLLISIKCDDKNTFRKEEEEIFIH